MPASEVPSIAISRIPQAHTLYESFNAPQACDPDSARLCVGFDAEWFAAKLGAKSRILSIQLFDPEPTGQAAELA